MRLETFIKSSYEEFVQLPTRLADKSVGHWFSIAVLPNFDIGWERSGVYGPAES